MISSSRIASLKQNICVAPMKEDRLASRTMSTVATTINGNSIALTSVKERNRDVCYRLY